MSSWLEEAKRAVNADWDIKQLEAKRKQLEAERLDREERERVKSERAFKLNKERDEAYRRNITEVRMIERLGTRDILEDVRSQIWRVGSVVEAGCDFNKLPGNLSLVYKFPDARYEWGNSYEDNSLRAWLQEEIAYISFGVRQTTNGYRIRVTSMDGKPLPFAPFGSRHVDQASPYIPHKGNLDLPIDTPVDQGRWEIQKYVAADCIWRTENNSLPLEIAKLGAANVRAYNEADRNANRRRWWS